MFETTSTLSVLAALLFGAACARPPAPAPRDGSLQFELSSANADATDGAVPGQLTITGLDRSLYARVELSSRGGSSGVRVPLPAGLYAVDAAASTAGAEPVIPALSAPKLVVVAAGRVTTVTVRVVDAELPTVAALDPALAQ